MISFFTKIIDTLNTLEIDNMLSGSVAMGVYVQPRATRDFDFIIHLNKPKIKPFVNAFKEGFYCDEDAVEYAVLNQFMFNVIDSKTGYKADFVILKNEEFRLKEFERKKQVKYFGKTINVVSAEDLLISKLTWIQQYQSAIQMEDIKALAQVKSLDMTYIKFWVLKLKLSTFGLLK